jgi:hypothetical protein
MKNHVMALKIVNKNYISYPTDIPGSYLVWNRVMFPIYLYFYHN